MRTAETWTLFGDCSLLIRPNDALQFLDVEHPTHVGTYQASGTITVPVTVTNLGPYDRVTATLYWTDGQDEVHLVEILDQTQNEAQFQVDAQPARTYDLTVSGFNKFPYEGTISLQETYSGVQSGNQTIHGAFLIDDDVCVQPSTTLNLERYSGSSGATFEIAESCQGTSYGFNSSECEIVVKGGATLYAKGIHFNGESLPSGTYYGTFSLPESGATLTLDGCTVEGGQNGIAMGGGSQLVRIMGNGGFVECTGAAIKCSASGEVEVTDLGSFTNCDKGIELSGPGNITLTIAGSTSQMNGCFEGIYVHDSPVVTASITGADFRGCGTGIRIETGHSATAFSISDCEFETNGDVIERKGIEVVGTGDNGPTVNVSYSTFQSGGGAPDLLDRGAVYRDGAKGTISNCTFACGEEKYRAVECRTGNALVYVSNNEFLGELPCPGPLSIDNRGIYSLGGVANCPRIHENYFNKYCYAVSLIRGSMADLGCSEDPGYNEFWSNCCDLQYWGRQQVPPGGNLYALWNCWNGYASADSGILCGSWVDWIQWDPGWDCGRRDFVPPSLPTAWALHVVGPNPCRESVEISLQIPEPPHQGEVNVKVMDLAGRVVRTLALEEPQAGSYALHWDGRCSDGTEVPNGVYVCRATVDGRVLSDKAILLREEP